MSSKNDVCALQPIRVQNLLHKPDRKMLERRIEAQCRLPPLRKDDDASVDFRSVIVHRVGLGVQTLSESTVKKIEKIGYDAYFVDQMNSITKIGQSAFYILSEMDEIELTAEYLVFQNFRDRLNPQARKTIAALLLDESQKKRN